MHRETGQGLFKHRIQQEPTDAIVERYTARIHELIMCIEEFSNESEEYFSTSNIDHLMQEIKERKPEIQYWLLVYSNRMKESAVYINHMLRVFYKTDPSLLYRVIQAIEQRVKPPFFLEFSIVSRLLSMLLGKKYILNTIPSTLSTKYTSW